MYKSQYSLHITVYTDRDKKLIEKKAGEELNSLLQEYKMSDILLMLSGGSSLSLLSYIDDLHLGKNITETTLDERFSLNPQENNFFQITQTDFYKRAEKKGCNFINTTIQDDTVQEAGERMEFELRYWRKKKPNGVIIITQGMGPDGHTAGMMPHPEQEEYFNNIFVDTDKWIIGYDAKNKNQYPLRSTVTIPFLVNEVYKSVMYVSGENKSDALDKVLSGEGGISQTPALVIKKMKDVRLFNDVVTQM